MAMRKIVEKYEPMDGDLYIGNKGDLWVNLDDGTIHISDTVNPGGNTVAYWDTNNITSLPGELNVAGQVLAGQSGPSGNTGGYSFNGNEGGNDTGMFSTTDGDLRFYSNATQVVRMTAGNLAVTGSIYCNAAPSAAGTTYGWDVSGQNVSVLNNGTVNFPNFSGTITVNNIGNGCVEFWLAGGGSPGVRVANTAATSNTVTYNAGILGYKWTNLTGGTQTFTFAAVRTRAHG